MKNNLEIIIDTYGYEKQSRKAMEELGELTVAINKYIDNPLEGNFDNLIEEIADVEIMLEQLKIMHNIEIHKIIKIKKEKIDRELGRIKMATELNEIKPSSMKSFYNECSTADFELKNSILAAEQMDEIKLNHYMRELEEEEAVKVINDSLKGCYCE